MDSPPDEKNANCMPVWVVVEDNAIHGPRILGVAWDEDAAQGIANIHKAAEIDGNRGVLVEKHEAHHFPHVAALHVAWWDGYACGKIGRGGS